MGKARLNNQSIQPHKQKKNKTKTQATLIEQQKQEIANLKAVQTKQMELKILWRPCLMLWHVYDQTGIHHPKNTCLQTTSGKLYVGEN